MTFYGIDMHQSNACLSGAPPGLLRCPAMSTTLSRFGLVAALLLATLATACANGAKRVELKGESFDVELALTREEQAMGLMFRESMPDDAGMLFIFSGEAPRSFWMKNTLIPLDILYFDSELKLVSAQENVRPCATQRCPGYPSEGPAQYVLELNAGKAKALGLEKGDVLTLLFEP